MLKITGQSGEVSSPGAVIGIYRLWQLSALLLQFSGRAHYHRIMPHYEAASVRLATSPDRWEGEERERLSRAERERERRQDRSGECERVVRRWGVRPRRSQ